MKHKAKTNTSTFQEDINTHNFNPKSNLNTYHPLSSISHDPLPLDLLYQSFPNPSSDKVQGSQVSQVKEQKGEVSLDISFLFQIPLCEGGDSFFVDIEFANLSDQSNELNFPNQSSESLGNHHFDDDDSIDVYIDEFPSASTNLSIY